MKCIYKMILKRESWRWKSFERLCQLPHLSVIQLFLKEEWQQVRTGVKDRWTQGEHICEAQRHSHNIYGILIISFWLTEWQHHPPLKLKYINWNAVKGVIKKEAKSVPITTNAMIFISYLCIPLRDTAEFFQKIIKNTRPQFCVQR